MGASGRAARLGSYALAALVLVVASSIASVVGPSSSGAAERALDVPDGALVGAGNKRLIELDDGSFVIFFLRQSDGFTRVAYQRSLDNGTTWLAPVDVATAANGSDIAAVASGLEAKVAFVAVQSSSAVLMLQTVTFEQQAGFAEASAAPSLSQIATSTADWRPTISLAHGNAGMMSIGFERPSALGGQEYSTSISSDSGSTWSAVPATCEAGTQLGAVVFQGTRLLCFTSKNGSIGFREWNGVVWPVTASSLPPTSSQPELPSLATTDDGALHAVMAAGSPPKTVYTLKLASGSNSWSTPVALGRGERPTVSTDGSAVYAYAVDALSAKESVIRWYAAPDGVSWIERQPVGGEYFNSVFDYNEGWQFAQGTGDALFEFADTAGNHEGNVIGTSSVMLKIDSAGKGVAFGFVSSARATVDSIDLWVTARSAPGYQVGLQADFGGRPDGEWIGSLAGVGGAVGAVAPGDTSTPTRVRVNIPPTTIEGNEWLYLVVRPAPDPSGLTSPTASKWMAVQAVGGLAERGGTVLQLADEAWGVVPETLPRAVVGANGELYSQEISTASPQQVWEYARAGQVFRVAESMTASQLRLHLSGGPDPSLVVKLLGVADAELWSAPVAATPGWNLVSVPGIALEPGVDYRLLLDSTARDSAGTWKLSTSGDALSSYGGATAYALTAPDRRGFNDRTTDAKSPAATPRITVFNSGPADYLYVGSHRRFAELTTVRASATLGTIALEYWNGSAWVVLSTSVNSLGGAGRIARWTPPADWERTSVNGYEWHWIRAHSSSGTAFSFQRVSNIRQFTQPTVALRFSSKAPPLIVQVQDDIAREVSLNLPIRTVEGEVPTLFGKVTDAIDETSQFAQLRAHIGSRYGGRWEDSPNHLTVAVAQLNEGDLTFFNSLGSQAAQFMALVDVENSKADLAAFSDSVSAALDPHRQQYSGRISFDLPANRLLLEYWQMTDAAKQAVLASVPPGTVLITPAATYSGPANANRTSRPYVGGLNVVTEVAPCTSNYLYRHEFDDYLRFATAGHCDERATASASFPVSIDSAPSDLLGHTAGENGFQGRVSAADIVFVMPDPDRTRPDDLEPEIHVNLGVNRRVIRYTGTNRLVDQSVDADDRLIVCMTGRSYPGGRCGPVTRYYTEEWASSSPPGWANLYCAELEGAEMKGGDSGAPVYIVPREDPVLDGVRYAIAVGINVIRQGPYKPGTQEIDPEHPDSRSCFQTAKNIRLHTEMVPRTDPAGLQDLVNVRP